VNKESARESLTAVLGKEIKQGTVSSLRGNTIEDNVEERRCRIGVGGIRDSGEGVGGDRGGTLDIRGGKVGDDEEEGLGTRASRA